MTDREETLEKMLRSVSGELDRTMSCLKTMFYEAQEIVKENEALSNQLAQTERGWVGLTDEDFKQCKSDEFVQFAKEIEAKLKEKNT